MFQLARLGPRPGYSVVIIAASCALSILSYDASMINNMNILPQYIAHFGLDASLIGLNTAIVSAGSVCAGPFVGPLIDRWGRKIGLMVSSILVLLGAVLQCTATKEAQFVIGRFLIGIACTISGTTSPMWVMELGSPRNKNFLVSIVVTGLPFAGLVATWVTMGVYKSGSDWAWRGPILGEALPALLCLTLLPFTDESPRWLIYQGYATEALEVITRLHANGDNQDSLVAAEYKEICDTLEYEKQHDGGWMSLITPASNLRRFTIAVLCNIFFQIVGAQMILYFFSFIIQQAGITDMWATLLINMGIAIWASLWVGVGGFLVSKVGEKKALVTGTSLMTLAFVVLAVLVYLTETRGNTTYGIGAVVVIFLFQMASCSTWFNLAYTYPPQILKYSQRGKGVAAAQAIGFCMSFLNLYTTPIAIKKISWRYYAINAGWNVAIVILVQWLFVNTVGKTLEEVDEIFDGAVHTDGIHIGDGKTIVLDGVEAGLEKKVQTEAVAIDSDKNSRDGSIGKN